MRKREIVENKILHAVNTNIKYIKTDGRNEKYVCMQHKHEDFQFRLITKGKGECMIGEYVVKFKAGDILFVGSNVPHCSALCHDLVESKIVQFHPDIFPIKLHELPDYIHISNILKKSQNGILFNSYQLGKEIEGLIDKMKNAEGIEKISCLFQILEILSKSRFKKQIAEISFDERNTFSENHEALQRAYDYLYLNLNKDITLSEISQFAHQNPTALCRAFKNKTGMTIFQFLNKIRIENVCKLLVYSDLTINQIAYKSGFKSMAYFNRRFRDSVKMSPTDYRKKMKNI